jgi:hypothetical protein
MDEAPNSSQGGQRPTRTQPAADGHQQSSQPCPQAAEYETNPTGAQPGEADASTASGFFLGRRTSLTDAVSKSTDLSPAGRRSDRIQIAERTQLPPLAAQRRTFRNRCRGELISGKRTRSYPSASGARRGLNGCSRLRPRCTTGCAQETCCSERDGRSHLASAEKREQVKQEEPWKSGNTNYDNLRDVPSLFFPIFSSPLGNRRRFARDLKETQRRYKPS